MRLHRFLIELPLSAVDVFEITDTNLLHQWSRVLRYGGGEEVCLLDGKGREIIARLLKCSGDGAQVQVLSRREEVEPMGMQLTLCFSLLKREHTELVLQKGAELGVARFQPILCTRTIKEGIKTERAEKILREATEQSGRLWLPELSEVKPFDQVLQETDPKETVFASLADLSEGDDKQFSEPGVAHLSLFIGPEGGWTEGEECLATERKVRRLRLSRQVLRAETACLAGAALLLV
ncbi:16S rRNA (uracil(1498)-N(3))-methyltransferase [Patescibacteria group bacterium]|nr:16S rRNA (uracil(1498)-N(3))-methyltransferase [Patescibacteria group bacterium]